MQILPDRTNKNHLIADIEVLRAVAVLVTVFQHQSILTYKRVPAIDPYFDFSFGVDIFFVVSGFVIARSLLPNLPAPKDKVRFWRTITAFWVRRIWRIWPTAWLWVGIIIVMASLVGRSGVWGEPLPVLQDAAAVLLQVQNLHRADPNAIQGPIAFSLYWSLSLEEQFYLLLPFVLFLVPRQRLIALLATLVFVQLFLNRWPFSTPLSGLLWSIRSDGLLLGVLIALSLDTPWIRDLLKPVFLRNARHSRWLSTLLPLFLMSALSARHIVWFGTGLIAILSAWLVWIASYDDNFVLVDGQLKRILVWIGARSYAIYLIHVPAFYFTQSIWEHLSPDGTKLSDGSYTWQYISTAAIVVALLSDLNYRLVEVPLRRKGAAIAKRLAEEACYVDNGALGR